MDVLVKKKINEEITKSFSDEVHYKQILSSMAKHFNHTLNNVVWLQIQDPNASFVMDKASWIKLNTQIKPGARQLTILQAVDNQSKYTLIPAIDISQTYYFMNKEFSEKEKSVIAEAANKLIEKEYNDNFYKAFISNNVDDIYVKSAKCVVLKHFGINENFTFKNISEWSKNKNLEKTLDSIYYSSKKVIRKLEDKSANRTNEEEILKDFCKKEEKGKKQKNRDNGMER